MIKKKIKAIINDILDKKIENEEEKGVMRKMLKIGVPIALGNMLNGLINFVDVFMVGQNVPELDLGIKAVTALGFANQVFIIFMVSLFGLNSGSSILSAQYYGNNDRKNMRKCLGVTIIIGLIFSSIFLLMGMFSPATLISFFTNDGDVLKISIDYFRVVVWSFPIFAVGYAFEMQLRVINKAKYSFYANIMGLVINIVGNYVLIFGKLGFPSMGIVGTAYATLFSRIVNTAYLIYIIYKNKYPVLIRLKDIKVPFEFYQLVLKISFPVFVNEILWVIGMSLNVAIFGRMGTDIAGSIQIVKSISGLLLTMIYGLTNATAVVIGNELGANNLDKSYRYAEFFLKIAFVMGVLIGLAFYISSPVLIRIMKISPELYSIINTIVIFEIMIIIIRCVNAQMIIGILRAGGDTLFTMLMDVLPLWFISTPLTYFVGMKLMLPLGVVYLASGMNEIVKLYPLYARMKSKKWINNLVR